MTSCSVLAEARLGGGGNIVVATIGFNTDEEDGAWIAAGQVSPKLAAQLQGESNGLAVIIGEAPDLLLGAVVAKLSHYCDTVAVLSDKGFKVVASRGNFPIGSVVPSWRLPEDIRSILQQV